MCYLHCRHTTMICGHYQITYTQRPTCLPWADIATNEVPLGTQTQSLVISDSNITRATVHATILCYHTITSIHTDVTNHLVMLSKRLATMLFMASKGFPSRALVTQPSLAVKALSCFTRDPAHARPCPNTFLPVLSGGSADSIFPTISTSACNEFTSNKHL